MLRDHEFLKVRLVGRIRFRIVRRWYNGKEYSSDISLDAGDFVWTSAATVLLADTVRYLQKNVDDQIRQECI